MLYTDRKDPIYNTLTNRSLSVHVIVNIKIEEDSPNPALQEADYVQIHNWEHTTARENVLH